MGVEQANGNGAIMAAAADASGTGCNGSSGDIGGAGRPTGDRGFTLIELLLVVIVIGMLLAVILPRAMVAEREAKFAIVRQHATEIGSYTVQWAQGAAWAKNQTASQTIRDILTRPVQEEEARQAGFSSLPLVDRYSGDPHFRDQVGRLIPGGFTPANPFNGQSYFSPANDARDAEGRIITPAAEPGLLYLVSVPSTETNDWGEPLHHAFYFIFTGQPENKNAPPLWYNNQGTEPAAAERGIFVYHSRH